MRCSGREKARWWGFSCGQKVRREVCAESETRCAASLGGMLGGLRNGESGVREACWGGGNEGSGGLTAGVPRRLGSGWARGAREAVKRVL